MADKMYCVELEISGDDYTFGNMMMTEAEYRFLQKVADTDNWNDLDTGRYASHFSLHCEELDPTPKKTATLLAVVKDNSRKNSEYKSGFATGTMAEALRKAMTAAAVSTSHD